VETVLLGNAGDCLTFRFARAELADGRHPDDLARSMAGIDATLLHSTSWRFERPVVVVTYAAVPDPHPETARRMSLSPRIARGRSEIAPSPSEVWLEDVAAHACRHLAFLAQTDPAVAAQAAGSARLWALILAHRPDVAGLLPA
jgi:hypothetical protein